MTLNQFIQLDEMEQAEAIWKGKQVAQRTDDQHDILLYKIDGFFVEIYYHRNFNIIRGFEAIRNKNQLLFYSDQIDTDQLL